MSRLSANHGQTAAEYLGLLLIVALTISALLTLRVDRVIAEETRQLICKVSEERCGERKQRRRGPTPAQRRQAARDRDDDGLSNRLERRLGTNPDRGDSDRDGLPDGRERKLRLDPTLADTDHDGLPDGVEVRNALRRTAPNDADTDDDGLRDGEELAVGTDPTRRDSDFGDPDGLSDAQEIALGTDPHRLDTDGDGNPDGAEVREGKDPLKDERSLLEKAGDFILDNPIDLGVGGAGGVGRNLAARYVDRVLGKVRRVGRARSADEAASIRRERLEAFRREAPPAVPPPARIELARPDELRGVSASEVERLAREAGFEALPATRGAGGMRYFVPGTNQSDGIRVMRADPRAPDAVKRGPYAVVVVRGRRTRVPLAGNPVLRDGDG